MTLLESLERGEVDPARFGHREHLECAWLSLTSGPFGRAADRVAAGLRRLAASAGKAERYHETQTWAFLLLVEERRRETPHLDFDRFLEAWPDLLDRALLLRHYSAAALASEPPRRAFILPGR
jgi:hypothetical protein